MTRYESIAKTGYVALSGLLGMTIAGELLHPLKRIGLGNLAAMIFDTTNYKLITGAFIGAMSTALLRTPLTYYFNTTFRPWLPTPRDQADLRSHGLITKEEYSKLLGYQGLPDYWHEKMDELAFRPLSYFQLAAIAKTGVYVEPFFKEQLQDSGFKENTQALLLDMYRKSATETSGGMMSGAATKRFIAGLSTEEQFLAELGGLGYTNTQIPQYLTAAKMDFATSYTLDLIDSYRLAVRSGNISLAEYRATLLDLGVVPERVSSYVLKERARLKPKETLTLLSPAVAYYETEGGKLRVDTLRRLRRKERISRDQELAGLLDTGMDTAYAKEIADNDDARLTEKGGGE